MFWSKVSQTSRNLCNRTATLRTASIRFFLKVRVYPTKSRYSSQTMPRRRAHRISAYPITTLCALRPYLRAFLVHMKAKGESQTQTINHCSSSQFCCSIAFPISHSSPVERAKYCCCSRNRGLRPSKASKNTRSSPLQCRPQCC